MMAARRRRRRTNLPVPTSPSVNEDMLTEILLRLPPLPSSLPRASLVCKRWRQLISKPDFLRLFRARHSRNAPLLGFFTHGSRGISFNPTLEPPDRIRSDAFSFLEGEDLRCSQILCCRHGLVLVCISTRLIIWDLSAGYVSHLSLPLGIDCWMEDFNGMVFRDGGDAQGDEHFQVVIVHTKVTGASACVYSSRTDEWGKPIYTDSPSSMLVSLTPGTLVGRSLYWALHEDSHGIIEFDLDKQCLTVTDVALPLPNLDYKFWVMALDDKSLGYIFQSIDRKFQLWKMNSDCDGDSRWVLEKSIDIDQLLRQSFYDVLPTNIVGVAEECNVFFFQTEGGVFKVHVGSMQCKKISEMSDAYACHSFTSVYTAGFGADGGDDPLH